VKGNAYTLFYAAALGTICALLLTAASSFTAPYKEANREAEIKLNILNVLQVPYPDGATSQELVEVFKENVVQEKLGELEVYRFVPKAGAQGQETIGVAFEGPGLWGGIKGFLALAPDMKTIRGITFYEQEETPGLGGEIAADWFREQFKGKKIVDEKGNVGITIRRGGAKGGINEVDAITGATMTCDKVEAMLDEISEKIVQESGNNGR